MINTWSSFVVDEHLSGSIEFLYTCNHYLAALLYHWVLTSSHLSLSIKDNWGASLILLIYGWTQLFIWLNYLLFGTKLFLPSWPLTFNLNQVKKGNKKPIDNGYGSSTEKSVSSTLD